MIESYDFGRMIIDGKEYLHDLIVFPDHLKTGWWREEGHRLLMNDLEDVFASKPKILVIGTGHTGCLKVDPEIREYCRKNGIKLVEAITSKAVQEFNRLQGPETVGAFHLTC